MKLFQGHNLAFKAGAFPEKGSMTSVICEIRVFWHWQREGRCDLDGELP